MTNKLTPEEIYQEYHKKVLSYIRYHIENYYDAEDICEDVFTKVFNKLDSFDETKASLSTWIFRIAKNTLIDFYRTKHDDLELMDNIEYVEEKSSLNEADLITLSNALKCLSNEEREIIVLKYYEDYSLTEISKMMNLSYGITKLRHNHALSRLKKELQDLYQ